jgi:hypothetical protein
MKEKTIILVLILLLILAGAYIGFTKYNSWRSGQEQQIFTQGAQYGYEQAVIQIVQQSLSCQPVPLRVQNETINIIAVDCLSLGGGNGTK